MNNMLEVVSQKVEEDYFANIAKLLKKTNNVSELNEVVRDLISSLLKNIGKHMGGDRSTLMENCNQVLEVVAMRAEPEEVVLELLDQMENADYVKYCAIMKALLIALDRCRTKIQYIETSLVTIRSCLEDIITSEKDFTTEEMYEIGVRRNLRDNCTILESVLDFHAKFISQISSEEAGNDKDAMVNLLLSRLIQIFDFFLPADDIKVGSALNNAKIRALELIKTLSNDPFHLLKFILMRTLRQQNKIKEKDNVNYEGSNLRMICDDFEMDLDKKLSVFENDYVISNLGYASFFYTILCSNSSVNMNIPSVYNPKFVFLSLAPLSISLFEKKFNKQITKGLQLLKTLLYKVDSMTLNRFDLYFQYHGKILTHVNNLMIYSQNKNMREMALTCFKKYFDIFDYEAKYLLLINYRPLIEHSGTLGLLITQLKDYISHNIDSESCEEYSKYYSGKLLYDLISHYCFLPNGENTDLVLHADQIISSLNLLRFILLKDKNNKTGFRNYLKEIDDNFFKPLGTGIESFKDLYKMRLEELENNLNPSNDGVELSINGQCLDNLTKEQQENALHSSLTAVELMDSLLLRVQECAIDSL